MKKVRDVPVRGGALACVQIFWPADNCAMPDPVPRVNARIECRYGECAA